MKQYPEVVRLGAFDYIPSAYGLGLHIKTLGELGLVLSYAVMGDYGYMVDCDVPPCVIAD